MRKSLIAMITLFLLVAVGFLPLWPHTNMFGTQKINAFEFFGGCWQGDIRWCDYDPFE